MRTFRKLCGKIVMMGLILCSFNVLAKSGQRYIFWHLSPAEGASLKMVGQLEKDFRIFFERKYERVLMPGLAMDSLLMVEGNERFSRCGIGPHCLSEIGRAARVEFVIAGQVWQKDSQVKVKLVLVEVSEKKVLFPAEVGFVGPPSMAHKKELGLAMFEPAKYEGSLKVACRVAGATVWLDGKMMGTTPLSDAFEGLRAGFHQLEIKKKGHISFTQELRVPVGKIKTVLATLPKEKCSVPVQRPYYKKWYFWAIGGLGVAALSSGIVLHFDAGTLEDNADYLKKKGVEQSEYTRYQSRADDRRTQAYVMYGVAAAGLATAGVIALLSRVNTIELDPLTGCPASVEVLSLDGGLGLRMGWRF
jgi:hypothetical protein